MSFHVTIVGGEDDGKSFPIDGQCIVGRAPGCQIQLSDPDVSWEHAALTDQDGRLFLQNLSAAGVRVQGRSVTSEMRLAHGDEIQLGGELGLRVEERVGDQRRIRLSVPVTLGALAAIVVILVALAGALREEEPPPAPMTMDHWRTAHQRLAARMGDWEARGQFPLEAIALFEEAWRLEVAYNAQGAAERWDTLRSLILTLPLPGGGLDERTIAEAAGTTSRALDVIMDWAPDTSLSMESRWRSDEAFADALAWFIQIRAQRAHEKVEAGE